MTILTRLPKPLVLDRAQLPAKAKDQVTLLNDFGYTDWTNHSDNTHQDTHTNWSNHSDNPHDNSDHQNQPTNLGT
jgi:hypothetical protein